MSLESAHPRESGDPDISSEAPSGQNWVPAFAGMSGVLGWLTVPRITKTLILLLAVQVLLIALDAAFPPDMRRARESSPVAMDRNGVWLRALPVENGRWRIRADLSRTDPSFVRRLIAVEDGRFWLHPGVDPFAVVRATASAAVTGHAHSGASTLTMQTARLLTPRPRTIPAKLVEMVRGGGVDVQLFSAW